MDPAAVKASIRRDATAADWALALVRDGARLGRVSEGQARLAERAFTHPLLRPLVSPPVALGLLSLDLRRRLFRKRVTCRLRTLSEVIESEGVTRIDLLKVDVEGAEAAVLDGCAEKDWPRIRQVVVEVHDADGTARAPRGPVATPRLRDRRRPGRLGDPRPARHTHPLRPPPRLRLLAPLSRLQEGQRGGTPRQRRLKRLLG